MEQFVILVIIGLISLINWLMQRAAEKREEAKLKRSGQSEQKRKEERNIYTQPPPVPAAGQRPPAPPQDPFKELMEALGLPADHVPQPAQRTPLPSTVVESEEFTSMEEEQVPVASRSPQPPEVVWKQPPTKRKPDEKETKLASAFAAQEDAYGKRPEEERSSVQDLLFSRATQRHAVILAEIFGPPRSVQEWGDLPAGR